MKIYEMLYMERHRSDKKYWLLNAEEGSKIVRSRAECTCYKTLYAIERETENMSLKWLMDVMYKEMSVEEIKEICNNHEKLEQFFIAYLSGERMREDLEEIKSAANSANDSASAALVHSLFN